MILAAAALVLLGLGLFVAGLATGVTTLYWACVAACGVAGVVLIAARRQMTAARRRQGAGIPVSQVVARAPGGGVRAPGAPAQPASQPSAGPAPAEEKPPVSEERPPAAEEWPSVAEEGPPVAEERPPVTEEQPPLAEPAGAVASPPAGNGRTAAAVSSGLSEAGEPPVEDVEVTDLLLVVDLTDEVLVVDEHPRYHLAGCRHLTGREAIPLPLDEARTDGFTPCGHCSPDRNLAERVRGRRKGSQ